MKDINVYRSVQILHGAGHVSLLMPPGVLLKGLCNDHTDQVLTVYICFLMSGVQDKLIILPVNSHIKLL